jgi:hypothetical protein
VEFARRLPQGEIYDFSCSRHDLLHDCQAEAVQETLCQWLDRHFPCRLGPRGKIERPSFCLLP